jgi:hypothetical protein
MFLIPQALADRKPALKPPKFIQMTRILPKNDTFAAGDKFDSAIRASSKREPAVLKS